MLSSRDYKLFESLEHRAVGAPVVLLCMLCSSLIVSRTGTYTCKASQRPRALISMKAEHQGVPASQLPSLGCDCLLCKLPRQGMWNQFSNGREYHCFSWVPLKSRAWGCTINTLGMIESFVWPDLFSRTVLTFCPGVCKASSVSTPGGNNSMAFSFLHNPPETTPDSSGNPGVQSFTSLPPECGGYSTLPSVTTDQQGWLGGGGCLFSPTALCMPPLELQDRQTEGQGGRRWLSLLWEAQSLSRLRE